MKILIVDDELVSRKKMDLLVSNLGYETVVADDGMEGWEVWKKERPKMVITDWMMPRMDGLELCKKIRAAEGSEYIYGHNGYLKGRRQRSRYGYGCGSG